MPCTYTTPLVPDYVGISFYYDLKPDKLPFTHCYGLPRRWIRPNQQIRYVLFLQLGFVHLRVTIKSPRTRTCLSRAATSRRHLFFPSLSL